MKSITQQVHELEKERDALLKRERETIEFLCSVGDNDPRSSGFIARRAMERLTHNYARGVVVASRQLDFPCTWEELKDFCNGK